uniref:AP2/ERF domain-containing protein n=1 Tax=Heterorhabditis bacteriophora TaxID=37862 RepID=A0A1I7XNE0_HETBA
MTANNVTPIGVDGSSSNFNFNPNTSQMSYFNFPHSYQPASDFSSYMANAQSTAGWYPHDPRLSE